MLRTVSRRAALLIPRVRRFYDYSQSLAQSQLGLQQELERARAEATRLAQALTDAVQAKEAAAQELESLKLEVYVLRSDFQRSVNLAEEQRAKLGAAEQAKEAAAQELEEQRAKLEAAERQLQIVATLRDEISGTKYRLMGGVATLSAEVKALRQLLRRNDSADANVIAQLRLSYLDLLESALVGLLYEDAPLGAGSAAFDPDIRAIGHDWPSRAHTMIGAARMRNLRMLAESVIEDKIKGDFLEAGVWRGGACIYMRGILAAHNVTDRRVLVADSFAGLPPAEPDIYPADTGDPHHTIKELAVSLEEVKRNFARYGLLDQQVVFVPGWFKDTLAQAPTQHLALLRLDGDMYASTMQALEGLYARLSPGGYVVIDDYILPACRKAVTDFRKSNEVLEPIEEIDGAAVFWRKSA
jgi:O-methyltransferase/8-demethyl-8-(2,3-dimethoxy-alpha-L-rhamnosyl)tetracenomycin-C 4'-O-methyltransferase